MLQHAPEASGVFQQVPLRQFVVTVFREQGFSGYGGFYLSVREFRGYFPGPHYFVYLKHLQEKTP